MKFSNLIAAVTCALTWALLLPASLMAESVSKLKLERSTDLQNWQVVPVTPDMLDANGEIMLENHSSQEFFRMAVVILELPTFVSQPVSNTAIEEEDSATLSVNVTGEGLSYQWYFGQSGDTTQPIDGATSSSYNTGALTEDATYWVRVTNAVGIKDSGTLAVTINRLPTITTQPVSQTIASGGTATLSVEASGTAPFTYQWYRGNVGVTSAPVGTNSASFTTPVLTATTRYWVKVSNVSGEAQSVLSTITIGVAPTINTQPASTSINSGSTATLSVVASGTAPLTYQWYQGSVGTTTTPVGTSSASFTTPALTATTTYWVRVSNGAGNVNSTLATVTVTAVTTPTGFALIPAGAFTMGDAVDGNVIADAPTHTVNVSAFYMAQNLVTKAQWDTVRTWAISNGYSDLAAGAGKASNHPVQSISWFQMVKYCNARSEQEGLTPVYYTNDAQTTVYKTGDVNVTNAQVKWAANGYRLPTEAEWEKAARGGLSGKRFPWGDTISHSQANYSADYGFSYDLSGSVNDYHPTYATGSLPYTSPVGSFAANGYGLYDMAGNVWQWCWDCYGTYDTGTPLDPRGVSSGSNRVGRGGCWDDFAYNCRVADRYSIIPSRTSSRFGFRVARSVTTPADMALIPAGNFTMGDSLDGDSDAPPVTVNVSAFLMGKHEVTKALWDEVRTWGQSNGYTDIAQGAGKAADHPAQEISWWDVVKWCNARSQKEGLTPVYTVSGAVMKTGNTAPVVNWSANGYRLPTEAEWEKAARGGLSGKRFPWGDTISHGDANFWNSGEETYQSSTTGPHPLWSNNDDQNYPYTSPVGSFAANGYGLHDMTGNVWEWCWDRYGSYSNGATDPRGADSGTSRVIRGGCWLDYAYGCRVARRGDGSPSSPSDYVGFRVARSSVP